MDSILHHFQHGAVPNLPTQTEHGLLLSLASPGTIQLIYFLFIYRYLRDLSNLSGDCNNFLLNLN